MTIEGILQQLKACDTADHYFPPTVLYNENWMLRIILDWFTTNSKPESLIAVLPKSKWYSEALLASAFLPRYRGCIFRWSRTPISFDREQWFRLITDGDSGASRKKSYIKYYWKWPWLTIKLVGYLLFQHQLLRRDYADQEVNHSKNPRGFKVDLGSDHAKYLKNC